jgi:hypothetical protein
MTYVPRAIADAELLLQQLLRHEQQASPVTDAEFVRRILLLLERCDNGTADEAEQEEGHRVRALLDPVSLRQMMVAVAPPYAPWRGTVAELRGLIAAMGSGEWGGAKSINPSFPWRWQLEDELERLTVLGVMQVAQREAATHMTTDTPMRAVTAAGQL